ncbi:calcium-activated chloride channel regulator 4A isoform X2 [Mastomys coucha]|uniref:calcium-activated chloride channel regulator 4A isoform X2 n=1 Tax=Mastomys coucha TaxID=35658 RepID=UPI0012626B56|nr:calcium-activated chloride channel regulator 4A isoform X2 [Mastomys coucha]
MAFSRGVGILLLLYLLRGSDTSLVRLNENGYEDIIIAIDPAVPEDATIIEHIKEMVTKASTHLFEATEKRFFFKNVSILIPESWKDSVEYRRPKQESYKHADVKVAPPTLEGRHEPYTRQFTECEEKAEYIHFTPDFVLGKKQDEYGDSGKLLVHEWAHLRWGVFDEYNEDQPFYSASSKKIKATRCSTGITGMNRVYTCQGGSCTTRRCRTNSTTKLYEKDCQFFPDKVQSEKASIMFMQSINSVTEFCKKENHNREAPTLHNEKCNYRSTWEVISNSEDFHNSIPMEMPPSPPFFSLLRIRERIVCLVLDVSGSMATNDRLNRMNQAAKYFLKQIIENRSWVGMVHFHSQATIKSELIQINSDIERDKLLQTLPTNANGGTSICSGIKAAFQVEAMSLLQIKLRTMDSLMLLGPWLQKMLMLPRSHFSTVGKDTFFLLTWSKQAPAIYLWDLKGTQITNFTMDMDSKMAYLSIPGTAQVGVWTYNLEANVTSEILTITVTSRAASSSVPPITVNAKVNTDTNIFPSPTIVYAEVLQGYTPIIGARVTATIESNTGKTEELVLLDNGAGADAFKDDGVYSRYFTAYSDNGRYSLKVRADGGTNSARRSLRHPSSRAAYIPGWVVDGEIQGNPPRPETTEATQPVLENFSRTASGGAFVMSNVPNSPLPDMYPPNRITDLQATLDGEEISLTWTAPGDDYDVGKVQQYIIRTSENVLDLRDNFNNSLRVDTTNLIPNEANSKETFVFKPENISEENATYLFIAIESVDKSNLSSGPSNIAQVALFTPQAEPIPDESSSSGVSISTIVLSVVGSVVLVCIIVSTTICILKKKRSASAAITTF